MNQKLFDEKRLKIIDVATSYFRKISYYFRWLGVLFVTICAPVLTILLLNPTKETDSGSVITFNPNFDRNIETSLLQVQPGNGRYFTDGSGRAVYLTGSHTWANLQNAGESDPPPVFDYTAYLDFLEANNHNFIRLWAWEQAKWAPWTTGDIWFAPMPYKRTGPGMALDSKPKYDVTEFNQAYFDRLRTRIIEAGNRGIYVSIMLFDGWSIEGEGKGSGNPWLGHPFNSQNNINGVDGDSNGNGRGEETHTLQLKAINDLQEAYVRKVIDTVNDLDNVLYEISNESHSNSQAWQYHMINYIKNYEASKPKQHPVGMTVEYPGGDNYELFASPADWISPNGDGGYTDNPPAADGSKVIILDTDHLWGIGGDRQWVWKSFTRGYNPIYMDCYSEVFCTDVNPVSDPTMVSVRRNMGYTLNYANRINLAAMTPRGDLCSTGYCLANPAASGAEYLVYAPTSGTFTVNLSGTKGEFAVEWFNPETGSIVNGGTISGGMTRSFSPPFVGDAVLYLSSSMPVPPTSTPDLMYRNYNAIISSGEGEQGGGSQQEENSIVSTQKANLCKDDSPLNQ
jgi:hypothetical protein